MWLVIVLASILLLAVVLLSIPVSFAFRFDTSSRPRLRVSFLWLFGLVNRPIKSKPKKKKTEENKKKKKGRGLKVWGMMRSRGLAGQLLRLVKSLLGCIHIRNLELGLRFGLDSPSDTGFLFGIVQPAIVFLPSRYSVDIRPDFSEVAFEGYSTGTITFRPICIVASVFGFLFSLASMRLFWGFITGKWKKKR